MDICWLVHRYGKWGEIYETTAVTLGSFGRPSDLPKIYQDKVCQVCGRVKSRHVRDGKMERG